MRTPPGGDEHHAAVVAIAEDGTETTLTLAQLRAQVGAAEAGLRRLGVVAGDRVVALVPNTIHALVGFLATAALGAVWSSCSPDFGAGSVARPVHVRSSPTVLIAVDGYRYGGKDFRHRRHGAASCATRCRSLAGAVHIPTLGTPTPGRNDRAGTSSSPSPPDRSSSRCPSPRRCGSCTPRAPPDCPNRSSTSVGGISSSTCKSLGLQWDIGAGDRFLWFTTTGWMMWNFLIGGLLVGATVVLYDG